MVFGSPVEPRRRQIAIGLVMVTTISGLCGCAAQVAQQQEEDGGQGRSIPIPSVKVPIISYPLTNRRCSDNLLERLLPEPDPHTPGRNW